jgi:predicted dithiol-disulfide oxidoreductase (DUF899 family)
MTSHTTGTRDEWLKARLELLAAEKALTRRGDELTRQRQALPWVRLDKSYQFDTDKGPAGLPDLFQGRSQLLVYHLMFGPDFKAACPSCSAIADGFNGSHVHLAHHDVMLWAVSRAPLAKLQAFKQRMGWTFPWASSAPSDFNADFAATFSDQQQTEGIQYNYQREAPMPPTPDPIEIEHATQAGVDGRTFVRERPGMSAFVLEDGIVYHTYSTYGRGVDAIWGMYPWLDRAPKGRNEDGGVWWRHHDRY